MYKVHIKLPEKIKKTEIQTNYILSIQKNLLTAVIYNHNIAFN